MKKTNIINVDLNSNDEFILVDPDTKKTVTISASELHNKKFFVPCSIQQHFLSFFRGKTECNCTVEAEFRMTTIADWNSDYE